MILADTSVWIRHLRDSDPRLSQYLKDGEILLHPFISGELACGNLKHRAAFLRDLKDLPQARVASHKEVLYLIEQRRLYGKGLGWVDIHLLASAILSGCDFWTTDKRLAEAAVDLRLSGAGV